MGRVSVLEQRMRKWAVSTCLVGIVLLLAAGCGAEKDALERMVPAGSSLIAEVDLARVLEDEDLEALYGALARGEEAPRTLDELLDETLDEIGLDLRQFSTLVLFGDASRVREHYAIIAQGTFDEDDVLAAVAGANGVTLSPIKYKGRSVHTGKDVALTFLGGDTLSLGTPAAVRSVVDVREGDLDRVSGKLSDAFEGLGEPVVRVALEPPPGVSGLSGLLPEFLQDLPLELGIFEEIEIVGTLADKRGDTIFAETRVDFTSDSAASDAADALEGLIKIVHGLNQDENVRRLVDDVKVTVSDGRLIVRVEADVEDLEAVAGKLQESLPPLPPLADRRATRSAAPPPGIFGRPGGRAGRSLPERKGRPPRLWLLSGARVC